MQEVVSSNPRGGQNFSHGKLSKIDPLVLKSYWHIVKHHFKLYQLLQLSLVKFGINVVGCSWIDWLGLKGKNVTEAILMSSYVIYVYGILYILKF